MTLGEAPGSGCGKLEDSLLLEGGLTETIPRPAPRKEAHASMTPRREPLLFCAVLAGLVAAFLGESLFGGKVLSPADVLWVSASFREVAGPRYEPANRLLMDPVLQFEPWLEFSRASLRRGRLPLWNDLAGCGAPLLANGQSAVFDPFHAIAYLGRLPEAHAWMAAARLWMAGLGMFLLARSWGFGAWGRWFAGLVFPFCGFLVGWLLFPVTSVAVWLPWLFLASDRVLESPGPRSIGGLALVVGLAFLAGHVQTSAHVLLAAGLYAAWRAWARLGTSPLPRIARPGVPGWAAGVGLGVALAAIEVVPLGVYLTKSPVWGDRDRERLPAWSCTSPRLLDAACTALPYAFGSQRRGHPNLARALGVHNLNESAGGFVGLATLVWLAPLALSAWREEPRVRFLAGLTLFGALGAFGIPPVDNLLRALPVLKVTDNRRLVLWVAFGLCLLGAIGLDRLGASARGQIGRRVVFCWVLAACGLLVGAGLVGRAEGSMRARALEHYARAASETPGADPAVYRDRAERQVRQVQEFYPALSPAGGGPPAHPGRARRGLAAGKADRASGPGGRDGPDADRPVRVRVRPQSGDRDGRRPARSPGHRAPAPRGRAVGADRGARRGAAPQRRDALRAGRRPQLRFGGAGAEPGLVRALYSPGPEASTSRREITWDGVIRARDRLREAAVTAVVGPTPPPAGAFDRVDRVGSVWVARLDGRPWATSATGRAALRVSRASGIVDVEADCPAADRIVVRDTFDAGWVATVDGKPAAIEPFRGTFLSVPVAAGRHSISLRYAPREVEVALVISLSAAAAIVFALTGFSPFRSTRIVAQGLGRTQAVGLESMS